MQNKPYKSALLFYPPVGLFQRGESRCQANIEESAAISLRACNDLGYMAAVLKNNNIASYIVDYQGEHKTWDDMQNDLKNINPDIVIMSITTTTLKEDLYAFELAKKNNPNTLTIAQGAFFFSATPKDLKTLGDIPLDIAIYGEPETIISSIIDNLTSKNELSLVNGIIYKKDSDFIKNTQADFISDLDTIPFPERSKMNNALYKRPDTNEPQATIQVSRGCPHQCTYCLTPIISGKQFRRRSINNIIKEIKECITKYNIKNFFFRADTFNTDKKWVLDLCNEIKKEKLNIKWVANSRITPIDDDILIAMKNAGCWLIALGIESGSQKTLDKIKKNITIPEIESSISLIKKHKIKIYAFFIIGFYWETKEDIQKTTDFALKINCDFYEIHIATPYKKTPLHADMEQKQLVNNSNQIGIDYFSGSGTNSHYISKEEIIYLRKLALRKIYLRPKYILKRILGIRNPKEIKAYFKYGIMLLKNLFSN